jgi:hypothetical protein
MYFSGVGTGDCGWSARVAIQQEAARATVRTAVAVRRGTLTVMSFLIRRCRGGRRTIA